MKNREKGNIPGFSNYYISRTGKLYSKFTGSWKLVKPAMKDNGYLSNSLVGDGGKLAYEDATHIYWAAFLALLDRGGTDNLCDLRLMALVDKISIYKSLLNLPGMKLSYQMAFAQVTKAISKGEFSKEDFKNLLEVYEDGTEKTKG